jgi:hypothetical protein
MQETPIKRARLGHGCPGKIAAGCKGRPVAGESAILFFRGIEYICETKQQRFSKNWGVVIFFVGSPRARHKKGGQHE